MRQVTRRMRMGALGALVAVMLLATGSRARDPDLWANGSPYVTTLAHAYIAQPVTVISVGQSMRNPLDVHAVFYLASHSDTPALDLWKMRQKNATYAQILALVKVPAGSLFTPLSKCKPPAALARAYRLHAENQKKGARPVELYNEEIMNLVGLKFCVDVMRLEPKDVCARMAEGQTMQAVIQAAIEADPYVASLETPRTVTWKGVEVKLVPYYGGEPHCNLAVYSPYEAGSACPAGDGYLMGFLRVRGRYVKGVAQPEGFEGKDIRHVPWFRNMCNRYFPACRKAGWAGVDAPDL